MYFSKQPLRICVLVGVLCMVTAPAATFSLEDLNCAPGCGLMKINNGICDVSCHNEACGFDGDDCDTAEEVPIDVDSAECAPGCKLMMINNGKCEPQCDVLECGYDSLACYIKPSFESLTPECNRDKCPPHFLDDGICQSNCHVQECLWDLSDCINTRRRRLSGIPGVIGQAVSSLMSLFM